MRFVNNIGGNVALIAAILTPVLFGAAAVGFDYFIMFRLSSQLQQAADSTALAGARQLGIAGSKDDDIKGMMLSFAESNFLQIGDANLSGHKLIVDPKISFENRGTEVKLSYYWKPFFAHHFDLQILPIKVIAKANLVGSSIVCTLALDPSKPGTIVVSNNSSITAENCSIQANSSNQAAIVVPKDSKVITKSICTGGGYTGNVESYSPIPTVDCPPIKDPLGGQSSIT